MPLSGTYFAGKSGSATVDGVLLPAKSWDDEVETDEIDVTNFLSVPADPNAVAMREFLGGFSRGTFALEGAMDPTLTYPKEGSTVPFIGKIGATYTVSGEMVVRRSRYGTNIDGHATFRIEGRRTGAIQLGLLRFAQPVAEAPAGGERERGGVSPGGPALSPPSQAGGSP
jgi:hypothetical protein